MNTLYTATKNWRDEKAWSLDSNPTVLFTLLSTLFMCSWKFNFVSRYTPRCFWDGTCWTKLWLKQTGFWFIFWSFFQNITSWGCLRGSGLKFVFHWIAKKRCFKTYIYYRRMCTGNSAKEAIDGFFCKTFYINW